MFTSIKRIYKILNVKRKSKNVIIESKANIAVTASFEGYNKVGKSSWFDGYMGYGTYIGDQCTIFAKIGKYCSIGHKVSVLTGTHPSHTFVSTHPVFYSLGLQNGTTYVKKQKFKEKKYADEKEKYGCIIGNDVWIGYNATIIGGCSIGDGAIVAAGALVNKDVEPYSIVAGQPAKKIGSRFDNSQIEWLLKFRWWDKSEEWIKENAEEFEDINKFMERYKKEEN